MFVHMCLHDVVYCSYSKLAFCDLTGRETRLPLKIKGDALGPKLQFSFDTLDIQNVFVDSSHSYEVWILICLDCYVYTYVCTYVYVYIHMLYSPRYPIACMVNMPSYFPMQTI